MRIAICDDDNLIIDQITKLLVTYFKKHHFKNYEIITFNDGNKLLVDNIDIDILFLDIEMPGVNGIYIGNKMKEKMPNTIIFVVTNYAEYLDDAMRFHVFRYLSKPIEKARFERNFTDALSRYQSFSRKIPIETKQGVVTVNSNEIVMIEAIRNRICVYVNEQIIESVQPLKYWINALPDNIFCHVHRSFIVNLNHITNFDHELIYLDNGKSAYLTKRRYSLFKETYLLFLESTR